MTHFQNPIPSQVRCEIDSQTGHVSITRVQEMKIDLNNTVLNLNSSPPSVGASPPDVESETASSPSWESLIVSVQSQLAIIKIAVQNQSADEIKKKLTIKEVVKHSLFLQQPIGLIKQQNLMKESQENLDLKLQDLKQKVNAINDFCEQVIQHLLPNDSGNNEKDVDELRTGLRFMICEQLKNNLDDWKNRYLLINIKTENQTDEKQCITFSLNSQIPKTYKIKRLDNKELQLYNLTSGVDQGEELICEFKTKPTAIGELKFEEKRGRSDTETMWVEVRYHNNDVYEGQWKDNERNGQGIMRFADGEVYVGTWKDGKMHGYGTYTFENGDVYEGQWKGGKKDGYGTYTFEDGDVYEGQWKEGEIDGQGTMRLADGRVHKGHSNLYERCALM